ncbi:hypothetical protein ABFP37_02265 [Burkholderia sp. RS01]|uniref:hypothetical protein n=1 Tax=unclassified Burkholderia TaxID=2613784 RepID=UPI003218DEDB
MKPNTTRGWPPGAHTHGTGDAVDERQFHGLRTAGERDRHRVRPVRALGAEAGGRGVGRCP